MRNIIILIIAIMLGGTAMAGELEVGIGPKIGYQTTKLSYKAADIKRGFTNNLSFGAFMRIESGILYIQPEILYFKSANDFSLGSSGQGGSTIGADPNLSLTLRTNNLQVPLLVGIKVIELDFLSFRVQAGPTANFVLKDETTQNTTLGGSTTKKLRFDVENVYWGLQAGFGVDISRLSLDINYSFGLSNLFEPGTTGNTVISNIFNDGSIDDTKQNVFMVTLGFRFF